MCLGIPMQILEIKKNMGVVESGGVKINIGLMLIENPEIGDWVIVHAGFAISKLNYEEAKETLNLLREIDIVER